MWGAVCVNSASTVLRGAGDNLCMVEILWHRRETRRKQRKQTSPTATGETSLLDLCSFSVVLNAGSSLQLEPKHLGAISMIAPAENRGYIGLTNWAMNHSFGDNAHFAGFEFQ